MDRKIISFRFLKFFRQYCTSSESLLKELNTSVREREKPRKIAMFNHNELTNSLIDTMICNERGLIALNKPYGLRKEIPSDGKKILFKIPASASSLDHLSFVDAIPYLTKKLNLKNLKIIKLPERYISGVSLLAEDDEVERKIAKCFRDNIKPLFTYLAVCVGIPPVLEDSTKLGITFVNQNNEKKAVFVEKCSKTQMRKKLMIPFVTDYRVLSTNEKLNVSLVRIANNRNKWHGLRLYCATRLFAPILGDYIMSNRVRTVNDVPVVLDPFNPAVDIPQNLAGDLLSALKVSKNNQNSIPLHLHLSQVDLPRFNVKGKTLIAKPSEHFTNTCEKLGLEIPEILLKNSNFEMNKLVSL